MVMADAMHGLGEIASQLTGTAAGSLSNAAACACPPPYTQRHSLPHHLPGHHGGGGRVPGGVGVHRGASHDGHDDRQNLSSSLPTPPPPPFCSQRDLIRHQASLLETINQKMAFLSAFKLPPAMTPNPMVQHQQAPPGKCDTLVEVEENFLQLNFI